MITVDEFLIKLPARGWRHSDDFCLRGCTSIFPACSRAAAMSRFRMEGFEGQGSDLTLVALSLRVAAQVGVEHSFPELDGP